jgi:uncharacterized protein YndB with AHSA1/START domain
MFKFHVTGTIARPVNEVFAYVADVRRQPEWEPNIVSCTPDADGPLAEGMTATQIMREKGGERRVTLTVADLEPGRRLRFVKESPFHISFGWLLEPVGGETRVTYPVELDAPPVMRAALAFMRVMTMFGWKGTPIHRDLARIKERLEGAARTS